MRLDELTLMENVLQEATRSEAERDYKRAASLFLIAGDPVGATRCEAKQARILLAFRAFGIEVCTA